MLRYGILLVSALVVTISCGRNMLSDFEKENAAEQATIDLENNKYDKVIEDMESELTHTPDDPRYLSILASAYAQRAGIDFLKIALRIVDSSDAGVNVESKNELMFLWDVIPSNLGNVQTESIRHAITLLNRIDESQSTRADQFKLSVLYVIESSLIVRSIDLDQDASLSVEELETLSDEFVDMIFNNLDSAKVAAELAKVGVDVDSQKAAEQIELIYTEIMSQSGETNKAKLINYLSNL